jgi:ribosome maturation protein Sdo1
MGDKKETPVSWLVEQLRTPIVPKELLVLEALKMESQKQQKYDEMLAMLGKIIKENETDTRSWATILEIKQLIKEAKKL